MITLNGWLVAWGGIHPASHPGAGLAAPGAKAGAQGCPRGESLVFADEFDNMRPERCAFRLLAGARNDGTGRSI